MCSTGQQPSSVTEALDAVEAGLAYLNGMDAADLPGSVQERARRTGAVHIGSQRVLS
jgi:hypothetical protein